MKLDQTSKSGITNHQVEEAIRMWDGGKGMTMTAIGEYFDRNPQSFRYHFKKRGVFQAKKVKK